MFLDETQTFQKTVILIFIHPSELHVPCLVPKSLLGQVTLTEWLRQQ
jgi:hypothetical protein